MYLFYIGADVQICIRESSHHRLTLTSRSLSLSKKAEARSRTKLCFLVLSARRGQCGQRPTSIGRVLYVERLTAGSTATTQFFCDFPSKSLCQACWAANLSRQGQLHSAGRENGLSVMRNGLYIFKTHQTGN